MSNEITVTKVDSFTRVSEVLALLMDPAREAKFVGLATGFQLDAALEKQPSFEVRVTGEVFRGGERIFGFGDEVVSYGNRIYEIVPFVVVREREQAELRVNNELNPMVR